MDADEIRPAARHGGRPTRADAAALGDRIVTVATRLFLADGFGATSIEAIAAKAGIAKRTFYHRFRDKADLFRAVIRHLMSQWAVPFEAKLMEPAPLEETLSWAAHQILAAALSDEALRLYRVIVAEAPHFPELARIITEPSRSGGGRLAKLFAREVERGTLLLDDPVFAAEQFVAMVLAAPCRSALGLAPRMSQKEIERSVRQTVTLFLDGCRGRNGRADAMPATLPCSTSR
ncbi:MAG TPA: TetR/AcrR family transcriptional regulator [Stellaceae bacterium]|nr:TetR/AcrR family transcriptional regulator [Stellaceae bacterium]